MLINKHVDKHDCVTVPPGHRSIRFHASARKGQTLLEATMFVAGRNDQDGAVTLVPGEYDIVIWAERTSSRTEQKMRREYVLHKPARLDQSSQAILDQLAELLESIPEHYTEA